jgi:hypothetical protein
VTPAGTLRFEPAVGPRSKWLLNFTGGTYAYLFIREDPPVTEQGLGDCASKEAGWCEQRH